MLISKHHPWEDDQHQFCKYNCPLTRFVKQVGTENSWNQTISLQTGLFHSKRKSQLGDLWDSYWFEAGREVGVGENHLTGTAAEALLWLGLTEHLGERLLRFHGNRYYWIMVLFPLHISARVCFLFDGEFCLFACIFCLFCFSSCLVLPPWKNIV